MNKPVAWMMKANDPDNDKDWLCFGRLPTRDEKVSHQAIPLYTHPVKEKDEEMGGYEVLDMNEYDVTVRMTVSDWEAILRKAQEK